MLLYCSQNKKLNSTKISNNETYKLMPNNNEKGNYNAGVSDDTKKFCKVL